MGRMCCARIQMYHALMHYKYRLRGKLKKRIKTEYSLQRVFSLPFHHAYICCTHVRFTAALDIQNCIPWDVAHSQDNTRQIHSILLADTAYIYSNCRLENNCFAVLMGCSDMFC